MSYQLAFPTPLHEAAAEAAYRFFQPQPTVDTVLVVNSLARGQGIPESDLDMAVMVRAGTPAEEGTRLDALWQQERFSNETLRRFHASGVHAHVHLDVVTGEYSPEVWDDGGGPDDFELGIGNQLVCGAPLHGAGPYFRELQARWLPYYPEALRRQRLAMVRGACLYDLDHVHFFVGRALYFQAFDRLYKGFQEFLQALFIARRVYPLAYNKWIRMQVEEWLGLPELYRALPGLISVSSIEGDEMVGKAEAVKQLVERWAGEADGSAA